MASCTVTFYASLPCYTIKSFLETSLRNLGNYKQHKNMAKRFTDTDIWKRQRWFRKLSPINKLAFCYIKDNCNHAGIWRVDCSDLVDDLGIDEFDLSEFMQSVNTEFDKVSGAKIKKERLLLSGSLLWLRDLSSSSTKVRTEKLTLKFRQ